MYQHRVLLVVAVGYSLTLTKLFKTFDVFLLVSGAFVHSITLAVNV